MDRTRRPTLIPALFALIALPTVLAGAAPRQGVEGANPVLPLAPAPRGAWTTAGGSPAGTRTTATRLDVSGLALQATLDVGGPLLSEPLVWQDRLVTEHAAGRERRLSLWDLRTGAAITEPLKVSGEGSLRPALWGPRLVLRTSDTRIEEYLVQDGRLRRKTTRSGLRSVGRPLLRGGAVLHERDGRLELAAFGQREPAWSRELACLSEPAWDSEAIYVLVEEEGAARPRALDPATGADLAPDDPRLVGDLSRFGGPPIVELEPGERWSLALGVESLWVRLNDPAVDLGLPRFFGLAETVGYGPDGRPLGSGLLSGSDAGLPLSSVDGWRLHLTLDEERQEALGLAERVWAWAGWDEPGYVFRPLARAGDGTGLAEDDGPWVQCGSRALSPRVALDLETEDVLMRWGGPAAAGALPTARGVLRWFDDGRIELWNRPGRARGLPAAPAESGRIELALDRDGRRIDGRAQVVAGADGSWSLEVDSGGRVRSLQTGELGFLAISRGAPCFAVDTELLRLGLELQIEEEQRERASAVCEAARGARDAALMAEVLGVAVEFGVSDSVVRRLEEALAGQLEAPRTPAKQRVEQVRAGLEGVVAARAERLERALDELPEEWLEAAELVLLKDLLAARPDSGAGLARLAARLPDGLVESGVLKERPLDWVAFLEQTRRFSIELVRPPARGERAQGRDQERLVAAQRGFPPGSRVGLRSPNLLVVTSVDRPAALAEIVARGELAAHTLNEMFAGRSAEGSEAREFEPLEVRILGSRQEYLEQRARGGGSHADLAWTAGYYSPGEGLSRLYLPEGRFEDVLAQVSEVFVHELTHHWMDQRCPSLLGQPGSGARPQDPGFWLVEGFASMVDGFEWDLEGWSFRPGSPRSGGIDFVAMADPPQLLAWDEVLAWGQADVAPAAGGEVAEVLSRWTFGRRRRLSPAARFYAQAEALASSLHATEAGRQLLLDVLEAYYLGDLAQADLVRQSGRSAMELGAEAEAFASRTAFAD